MPSKTIDDHACLPLEPPTIDPYEILSVQHDADEAHIKKAYRKASLKHHPDKARDEDKIAATQQFQKVVFAYAILSDPRRRRNYDRTGSTAEVLQLDDDFDWASYFHERYADLVTSETINRLKNEYQGGDQEREDVLKAYERVKGNMEMIYQQVMHSDMLQDDDRFRNIIDRAIEDGKVLAHQKYKNETKEKREKRLEKARRRAEKEAKEADEHAEEMGINEKLGLKKKSPSKAKGKKGEDDLAALIQQRQLSRGAAFFGSSISDLDDEPPEEAFAAMGKRLEESKKRKGEATPVVGIRKSKKAKAS